MSDGRMFEYRPDKGWSPLVDEPAEPAKVRPLTGGQPADAQPASDNPQVGSKPSFGLNDLRDASLGAVGERLPELVDAVDAYTAGADVADWQEVARQIAELSDDIRTRDEMLALLPQLEARIGKRKEQVLHLIEQANALEQARLDLSQRRQRIMAQATQELAQKLNH
jgi:hypothetical protein